MKRVGIDGDPHSLNIDEFCRGSSKYVWSSWCLCCRRSSGRLGVLTGLQICVKDGAESGDGAFTLTGVCIVQHLLLLRGLSAYITWYGLFVRLGIIELYVINPAEWLTSSTSRTHWPLYSLLRCIDPSSAFGGTALHHLAWSGSIRVGFYTDTVDSLCLNCIQLV